jgi:hypothetical protein
MQDVYSFEDNRSPKRPKILKSVLRQIDLDSYSTDELSVPESIASTRVSYNKYYKII